jgi:diguanylate cyclase (GGDEF)-like protein/PAS domain S-box-containing protein
MAKVGPDESGRLNALSSYAILNTPPEAHFDHLTQLAASICEAPVAGIALVGEGRPWFKSVVGFDFRAIDLETPFCMYAIRGQGPFLVSDASKDRLFAEHPVVIGEPGVRFYAGVPLVAPDGFALGTLAVMDRVPRTLTDLQITALKTLAEQAMVQIELRRHRHVLQSVTAAHIQKQAELESVRLATRLMGMLDGIADAVYTVDRQWRLTYLNKKAEAFFGQSRETLLGKVLWELLKESVGTPFDREFHRALRGNSAVVFEEFHAPSQRWCEIRAYPSEAGLGVSIRDVTERKQAEDALRASEERFKNVARATSDAIWDWDAASNSHWWNEGIQTLFGYQRDEFENGIEAWLDRIHPDEKERVIRNHREIIERGGENWTDEYRFLRQDGSYAYVLDRAFIIRDGDGRVVRMVGAMTDLTTRKQYELELARLNRALQMRSACNELLIRATDEAGLLTSICRLALNIGAYRMAWVGYAQDDENRSITPVAHAGDAEDAAYVAALKLSWSEAEPIGRGLAGRAIRSGLPAVAEDIALDPTVTPWLASAERRGYRGTICLPLRNKEHTFGLLTLYSTEVRPVTAEELKLLQELADDLAYGIGNIRAQDERRRIQTAVLKVAASVSANTGIEFFQQLARNMAEAVGAYAGFVARLLPGEPPTARTIAGVIDGVVAENFEYLVEGTPCAPLMGASDCVVPAGVVERFPGSPSAALGAQAYVGRRLESSTGQPVGLLFVIFREPIKQSDFVLSTLQIFAARAAGELERENSDARIREQASLLDKAKDAIIVLGLDGRVRFWNNGAERVYGWTSEEAIGQSFEDLLYGDSVRLSEASRIVLEQGEWSGELTERRKDGTMLTVEANWTLVRGDDGQPQSILSIKTDITQRKADHQKLLYLAEYDQLTGLPNRALFLERLTQSMARTRRTGRPMAMMYLDIDYFKRINDGLGHNAGDELLKEFAVRLKGSVREVDTVARLGGDEFTILLEELQEQEAAATVALKIIQDVAGGFSLMSQPVRVTTSIGIAIYRGEDISHDKLIIRADQALYQAKKAGRNTFIMAKPVTGNSNAGEVIRGQRQPAATEENFAFEVPANDPSMAPPVEPRATSDFIASRVMPAAGLPDGLQEAGSRCDDTAMSFLTDALAAIRTHLRMDVAFISEFTEGRRVFRQVDSSNGNAPIQVGGSDALDDSYCQRVIDGRLPELIPDAFDIPAALELPATAALPVRAHLSVPIRLQDGRIYGTFCCFSSTPDRTLNHRDLDMMRMFADLSARQIDKDRAVDKTYDEVRSRIQAVLCNDALTIVYQPIYDIREQGVVGFEVLSRFPSDPGRAPNVWFDEAAKVGLGIELEIMAIEKALAGLADLPRDIYVSFNASPCAIISGEVERVLEHAPLERLMLEVTEHSFIQEYFKVNDALRSLRKRGLRIAVDDAGAGYASFRHILELAPEVIKLDISLTRDIDSNVAGRALASALIQFAAETGSKIVAEGVETAAELHTLRDLGVAQAQGYLLGRPSTLESAAQVCRQSVTLPMGAAPHSE